MSSSVVARLKCEPAPNPNAPTFMTRLITSLLLAVSRAVLKLEERFAGLSDDPHDDLAGKLLAVDGCGGGP